MFKLVVLSALVAVAVAKPQLHQSAIAYSAPHSGHSSTFVASAPGSALSSSSSSSLLNNGDFVSNTAHAVASPAIGYAAPGYHGYTPSVSAYSTGFASSNGVRFSTPAAFGHDNHNYHQDNNGQRFH